MTPDAATLDQRVMNRIVARHPREGWITLDARLTTREGAWQTTEHETATDPLTFSTSGAMWLRRTSRDCHSAGQMLDALVSPGVGPVGSLTAACAPWTTRGSDRSIRQLHTGVTHI